MVPPIVFWLHCGVEFHSPWNGHLYISPNRWETSKGQELHLTLKYPMLQLWRFSACVGLEIKWVSGNTMMLLNTDFLLFFLPRGLWHYVPAPPCNYFLDNLFVRQQHGPSRDPGSLSSRLSRCSARGNKFSFHLEKDKIQNSWIPQTSSPVVWRMILWNCWLLSGLNWHETVCPEWGCWHPQLVGSWKPWPVHLWMVDSISEK